MAKTSEKLELINSLRESLTEKEAQHKEVSDKLLQTEHAVSSVSFLSLFNNQKLFILLTCFVVSQLENVTKKCSSSEKQCAELKTEVLDVTQKLNVLKEKVRLS